MMLARHRKALARAEAAVAAAAVRGHPVGPLRAQDALDRGKGRARLFRCQQRGTGQPMNAQARIRRNAQREYASSLLRRFTACGGGSMRRKTRGRKTTRTTRLHNARRLLRRRR